MNYLDRERVDREEQAEGLCEVIRDYLLKHPSVEVELAITRIPADAWDEQPGSVRGDFAKGQLFGPHVLTYYKEGA